jgi:glucose-6-phosphate 1-epimerase
MSMGTIEELAKRFEIPGCASVVKGLGGLASVKVKTEWSTAEIFLHGAHMAHFQKANEPPILWLSQESRFEEGIAIRGGIPVIFPWFGPREGKPAHGFARVKLWELREVAKAANGAVKIHLRLPECAEAAEFGAITVDYIVTVSDKLELQLVVANVSPDREISFEECLHTYFTVGDIGAVSITGLKGTKYLDKVAGSVERTETNEAVTIASEVDRVYMDTTAALEIRDDKLRRKIRVEKAGSASTVVWNPWIAKSKAMADFGDEEYHEMVCVESGNVAKNKITLTPGKTGTMTVKLSSTAY